MCEKYVERPLYLLIADWMMAEDRWITAKEISRHFDIEHCKAINTLSYILSEVGEIVCEVKMIPNQIAGRGCQCQRLVKVISIDSHLYNRLSHNLQEKGECGENAAAVCRSPTELNREQKWQMMLSKSMRR